MDLPATGGDGFPRRNINTMKATNSIESLYCDLFKSYPDVLSLSEMSEILHISTKTGGKLLQNGIIKSLKIGKTYRLPKPYLISYLYEISLNL